jgi:hypothetical protein
MASQQQIDANRQNAQKSTGPKTPQGKAAVSQNALKHGLTAQQACINGEDKDEFDATRQSFEDELKPVGPVQTLLVEQIVMAAWRLARLRLIEGGLFQLRAADDARAIDRDYENVRPRTRLAYLFLSDVRGPNALANLGRYEARVERSFYRALHELQRLQAAPENTVAKQSQIIPDPMPQKDLTPTSGNHPISKSPNPKIPPPPHLFKLCPACNANHNGIAASECETSTPCRTSSQLQVSR